MSNCLWGSEKKQLPGEAMPGKVTAWEPAPDMENVRGVQNICWTWSRQQEGRAVGE